MAKLIYIHKYNAIYRLSKDKALGMDKWAVGQLLTRGCKGLEKYTCEHITKLYNKTYPTEDVEYIVTDRVPGEALEFEMILRLTRNEIIEEIVKIRSSSREWFLVISDYCDILKNGCEGLNDMSDVELLSYYKYVCHPGNRIRVDLQADEKGDCR